MTPSAVGAAFCREIVPLELFLDLAEGIGNKAGNSLSIYRSNYRLLLERKKVSG